MASFPDNQYRFGVYDYQITTPDNRHVTKLVFISWTPDSSPLKGRVLYATSKESFKKYLDLNTKDYTVCSKDDVQFYVSFRKSNRKQLKIYVNDLKFILYYSLKYTKRIKITTKFIYVLEFNQIIIFLQICIKL